MNWDMENETEKNGLGLGLHSYNGMNAKEFAKRYRKRQPEEFS